MKPILHQSFEKQLKYGRNDVHQLKITKVYMTNVVIKCGAPIYMVEQEEFHAFMNHVDPKWIPCGEMEFMTNFPQ